MERSSRGRAIMVKMAARPWLHLLLLSLAAGVLQVHGQSAPDSTGFISIDCGLPEQIGSYVDDLTKLRYASDAGFTDAGVNQNVSAEHIDPSYTKRYPQVLNVRAFPGGAAAPRSCYTFPSLVPGSKYLVRAVFMYGNYDGLNRLPVFDLHLGVNFWNTVNLTSSDKAQYSEIIAVVPGDSLQVCLVDIGSGTPFISWLDLRPLKNAMYPQVNATQALVLFDRTNFGGIEKTIRYPDDPYDRAWSRSNLALAWWSVSTIQKVQQKDEDGMPDLFRVPSVVMQTAITPLNASKNIEFSYVVSPNHVNPMPRYMSVLYFAEVEVLAGNDVRMFSVSMNNLPWIYAYKPRYLVSENFYNGEPLGFSSRYNFTLKATAPNSTMPPAINAAEFFSLVSTANVGTEAQDVSAMTAIKAKYAVKKNWAGDPCSPKTVAWDGLNCSYPISSPPRITSLNLSFGGLNGDISSHFGNLKAIQYLDLSHNKLTGPIPDVLSLLPSLVVLDLSGNQLSGSIPSRLLKRTEDGSLTLRYDNNPSLCSNSSSCQATKKKSNSMLAVYIVVPIFAVVVTGALVVLLLFLMRKKQGSAKCNVKKRSDVSDEQWQSQSQSQSRDGRSSLLQLDNRRFTYRELEVMTDDFRRVLGRGGFGCVYDGILEDGTRVAVKLRSESSNQGATEFLAEVRSLAKIHHKNLVSLIGYCKDGEYLALVYEHMSEGNLQDKLRGRDGSVGYLTWRQRLRIALESAQGLEYLHKSCSPPLLHRDVKTSNILLSANLKAKVADFGLLKAFNHDDDTHVSTARVVGTHGYLAPEYAVALQLTEKSDVYSFGVVLLEMITGQPPILQSRAPGNIIEWVRQRLARGNIEDVVDACMRDDYDVNSVWKAADVALRCASHAPAARPTMTDVVMHLQECLELEESRTGGDDTNGSDPNSSYSMYNSDQSTDVCQSSRAFEMEHNFGGTLATGPATR